MTENKEGSKAKYDTTEMYAPISSGSSKKMQDLLRRIYTVHQECGGDNGKKKK
jgi:hypothetical protein